MSTGKICMGPIPSDMNTTLFGCANEEQHHMQPSILCTDKPYARGDSSSITSDPWVLTLAVLLQLVELRWAQTHPAPVSHAAWGQGLCRALCRASGAAGGADGYPWVKLCNGTEARRLWDDISASSWKKTRPPWEEVDEDNRSKFRSWILLRWSKYSKYWYMYIYLSYNEGLLMTRRLEGFFFADLEKRQRENSRV